MFCVLKLISILAFRNSAVYVELLVTLISRRLRNRVDQVVRNMFADIRVQDVFMG